MPSGPLLGPVSKRSVPGLDSRLLNCQPLEGQALAELFPERSSKSRDETDLRADRLWIEFNTHHIPNMSVRHSVCPTTSKCAPLLRGRFLHISSTEALGWPRISGPTRPLYDDVDFPCYTSRAQSARDRHTVSSCCIQMRFHVSGTLGAEPATHQWDRSHPATLLLASAEPFSAC